MEPPQQPDSAQVTLVELLQSPACLLNGAGGIVRLNAAWGELAGRPGDACDVMPWAQLICPEDRHTALAHFRTVTISGNRATFECRLSDRQSTARWHLLSLQSIDEELTTERRWLCIGTDIHELKRREIDLERLASIQTDMLNISADCIKLISLDGTLVHMNRAGCRALGVPDTSAFGMSWLQLLPEDVRAAGTEALAAVRAGTPARFAGRSALPGQRVRFWDNMLTPITGDGGQPMAVLCVSRDVTMEHEVLDTLRESRDRLAIAARVGGLGIWDYHIDRNELHCDDAWYRIMGRDPKRPIGSIEEFRPFIHPDDVDRATEVKRTVAELVADSQDYSITFRIIRPNGEIRWVRSAACLVPGESETRAVGFVVDITDAWRGELALREEKERLATRERWLTDMVEHLPLGAVLVTGEQTRVNRATEIITGYDRRELQTKDHWFATLHREMAREARAVYQAGRDVGFGGVAHGQFYRKDGLLRTAEFVAALVGEHEVWLMRDVTESQAATAALKKNVRELEDALAQVKQLRGLLPICSYCKKVRNRQDYWEQVEAYISRYTDAKFSHGICPECWTKEVAPQLE